MADDLLQRAEERARAYASLESLRLNGRRRLLFYLGLIFALITAVEGALIGSSVPMGWTEFAKHGVLYWGTIGGLVVALGLLFGLMFLQRRIDESKALVPADFLFRLQDVQEKFELSSARALQYAAWLDVQSEMERNVFEYEVRVHSQLARALANPALAALVLDGIEQHFQGILALVVETLESFRHSLLSYDLSDKEFYFFDIFELQQRGDDWVLHRVARKKTPSAKTYDRDWPIGVGEVGDCIYEWRTILRDESARVSLQKNSQWHDTDDIYFKRRMSTPIRATDGRRYMSYGAICLTSSNSKRLQDYEKTFVENLTRPLTTLFERREEARKFVAQCLEASTAPTITGALPPLDTSGELGGDQIVQ